MSRIYETEQRLLFDLSRELGEQHDLAQASPDVVLALDTRMMDYLRAAGAEMPRPNPGYEPGGERSGDRKGGQEGKGGMGKGKGQERKPRP
jgi:hypothetical protein